MRRKPGPCKPGCMPFRRLKEGEYFQYCGPIAEARRSRGEPVAAYKKVGGPKLIRGTQYAGGAVEMLLKARGWGDKSAPYRPVKGNPCIRKVSRDFAVRYAERRARFAMMRDELRARRAG